jgi:delta24(24(1))-sterol reductase
MSAVADMTLLLRRDMYYEKLGFILTFWNMAGVPFTYCHCALYLANHDPSEYHWSRSTLVVFSVVYLFMYWMWDSSNGQKNSFRQQERGQLIERKAFPHMPWTVIENPRVIETKAGDRILVDGWFAIVRKPNYVPDMFFSMSWGLITGFGYVKASLLTLRPSDTLGATHIAAMLTNMPGVHSLGFTLSSSW